MNKESNINKEKYKVIKINNNKSKNKIFIVKKIINIYLFIIITACV